MREKDAQDRPLPLVVMRVFGPWMGLQKGYLHKALCGRVAMMLKMGVCLGVAHNVHRYRLRSEFCNMCTFIQHITS